MSKKTNKSKQEQASFAHAEQHVDWAAIAALERDAHKASSEEKNPPQQDKALSFEEWWLLRETDINKPSYYKEILRADFKARGLQKSDKLERWDWAAKQFGLKW